MSSRLDKYRQDLADWDPELAGMCTDRDLVERIIDMKDSDDVLSARDAGTLSFTEGHALLDNVRGDTRQEMLRSIDALLGESGNLLSIRVRTTDPTLATKDDTPGIDALHGDFALKEQLRVLKALIEDSDDQQAQEAVMPLPKAA